MKLITRVAATGTAVLSITALAVPLATSASAATSRHYDSGKIRVCVQGLRGGEADVRVAWNRREIDSGTCTTFRGLRVGRTYRVVADADRGCRIFESRRFVTAQRDARTVVFFGRCFGRHHGGNHNGGNHNGNWDGNRDGNWDGNRDGNWGGRRP